MTLNTELIILPEADRDNENILQYTRELHLAHHAVVYRREPSQIVILRIVNPRRRRR